MDIKFIKDGIIEIFAGYDHNAVPEFNDETVTAGDEFFDLEFISDDDDFVQFQFGDGDVGFINKELFIIKN